MAGGYRCSLGHAWTEPAGHTPTACPVCGDTTLLPVAERPEPAFAPTLAAVAAEPDAPRPPEPVTVTLPDSPSFSSLTGMPDDPGAPTAAPVDHGSVVPFGGGDTVDFMPRPLPPPLVPGYEIEREVGRGGMGVVYKARQLSLNRPVALKMILAGSHAGPAERDRFRREAEAVATLQNAHIVQIFEIGEANGQLYLALEYIEGGSLAQHLKGTPWPARDAAELVELLARAVHYAHSQGVVHRDLKPGNVLLSVNSGPWAVGSKDRAVDLGLSTAHSPLPTRTPKITDFGLAKKLGDTGNPDGTKTGAVMGTPSYIAPEQASGKTRDVGPGADVYALGAILYELLTGRPPFLGETPLDTVLQVLHDDPVPPKRLQPTVPRDLETICLKCLNKSPAKRYASADELAEDLRRFRVGEPIKARPLSTWGRGVKWARRHPSLAALGLITAAVTVALVSVLSVAYAHVREAVTEKEAEAARAREATAAQAEARRQAEKLAAENEQARQDAVKRNEELRREAERTRRAAFALQLAQIAAMCERDPRRALTLLEDETRCPPKLRDFTWAYLHRLCQREERVYAEHPTNDPLHAVAYSPTGAFVATAGSGGRVRLWDPRTGRTWAVLVGNTARVTDVAFSPDGGVVATAGADRSVRLWELPVTMLEDARKAVNFLSLIAQPAVQPLELEPSVSLTEAHAGGATCVAFGPDGRFLTSGGEDGMIRWWDLGGWHLGHLGNASAAAGGGRAVAAALVARAASSPDARPVWEARAVPAHTGGVLCLAFAASGKVLVSGGADKAARVWAPDGVRQLLSFERHTDAVRAVAVSPDGSVVATVNNPANQGAGPTIRLISTDTGRDIRRLTGHGATIYSLAISPDGELLASAGFDKTVRLWGVEDGQEHGTLYGHELTIAAVAFAPDRRTVVSVGYDATARVWHTAARPHDPAETMRDAALTAAGLSSAGTAAVVGDDRGRVQLHRSDVIPARPGSPPPPFLFAPVMLTAVRWPVGAPPPAVRAAAVSPDGMTVAASTDEGALFVWRVLRLPGTRPGVGLPVVRPIPVQVPRAVYAMAIDPTGRWLVTLDADGVRAWDLRALPAAHPDLRPVTPEGPGLIYRVKYPKDLAFGAAGERLAVTAGKGVAVLAFPSGRTLAEVAEAHPAEVETVAFGGKAGELLATADANGLIRVWKVGADRLDPQAELAGHTGPVYALAFNPDGSTLASGGVDRVVLLWDPVTGQERAVLTGHADRVLRVQFLPDASALVTLSRDGAVKRWRAAGGAQPAAPVLSPSPPRPPVTRGRG